jgi:hypothetical protein
MWNNAASSATVYVSSGTMPKWVPYYWALEQDRLLRSDPTLTITGIGGR